MRTPILGFRAWSVAKPTVVVTDPGYRPPPPTVPPIGRLAVVPELEAWLERAQARPSARPRKVQVTPPEEEPGTLHPIGRRSPIWTQPGPVRFECSRHAKPDRNCTCGIYAWLRATDIEFGFDVVGAIVAWGHLVLHGVEGFRAEWGRIVALSAGPRTGKQVAGKWAKLAAERLGVPFVPYSRLEEVGREFGYPITWEYKFE